MDAFDRLDRHLRTWWRRVAIEHLAVLGSATVLVVATLGLSGAIWASRVSSFAGGRRVLLALAGAWAVGALTWCAVRSWRLRRDRFLLARRIQRRVPDLGRGLEAVLQFRERALDEDAPFSAGLLVAQAVRAADLLDRGTPGARARHGTARRLGLAALVPVLAGLVWLAFDPWPALRGVRNVVGLPDAVTPGWLIGPANPVDTLAFDVRTALLRRNPDGTNARIPGDETGDVAAPAGTEVEVSGRLARPAGLGHLVVEGDVPARHALAIGPGDAFRVAFPIVADGTWHLEVVAPPGILLSETARRRVMAVAFQRPVVRTTPPEREALRPGETAVVRFAAESSSGLIGVDAVYEFPLDPDRQPVRVRVREVPPGTRRVDGEVAFTLPDDVLDVGGRVDLVIEALGTLGRAPEDTGRAEPIRFLLDSPEVRTLAALERRERLLADALELLASLPYGDAGGQHVALPEGFTGRLDALARGAREVAAEAASERGGIAQALATVATDLETLASAPDPGLPAVLLGLERSVLSVDDVVARTRGAILAARLAGLSRDATRLRQASGGEASAVLEARRAVLRARRTLGLLDGTRRHWLAAAELEGGMLRFVPARLARVSMRARERLLAADQTLAETGVPAARRREVLNAGAAALAEVVQAHRESPLPGTSAGVAEIALPAEVLSGLRQALALQRDVMDRTAEAAFLLKRRTDQLTGQRAPDPGRLASLVAEARGLGARVELHGLDTGDAQEMAAVRDDLGAAEDLLGQGDLVTARRVVDGLLERVSGLVQDWRDIADWTGEERPDAAAFLRAQANRLSRVVVPLRDAARLLADWDRQRAGVVTRDDRDNATAMLRDQERALAVLGRAAEALRRAAGSDADEHVATALAARRNMEEAVRRLAEVNPTAAEEHQRQAVQDMQRLRKALERGAVEARAQAAAVPWEDQPVALPAPARDAPGDAFAREVRAHAGDPVPASYEEVVRAYYEAILAP